MTVNDYTSEDWSTSWIEARNLQRGDVVPNVGVVDNVQPVGVFMVCNMRSMIWQLSTGTGDEHNFDRVFHQVDNVLVVR